MRKFRNLRKTHCAFVTLMIQGVLPVTVQGATGHHHNPTQAGGSFELVLEEAGYSSLAAEKYQEAHFI